jgi:hypothetical protein
MVELFCRGCKPVQYVTELSTIDNCNPKVSEHRKGTSKNIYKMVRLYRALMMNGAGRTTLWLSQGGEVNGHEGLGHYCALLRIYKHCKPRLH